MSKVDLVGASYSLKAPGPPERQIHKNPLMLRRNAYIMVAVHGSGYCTSAFHAAKLILNNILRVAAVNVVGDALLWLGKVYRCISLLSHCFWPGIWSHRNVVHTLFTEHATRGPVC